ncbi:MAG: gliding motility lipoprotein GldD [Spirosomataceae bacterium]
MKKWGGLFILTFWSIILACQQAPESFTPKPRGFFRIPLPPVAYQSLAGNYPYQFEYSTSAVVQPDTHGLAEPHWIILYYPALQARVQFTYKNFNGDLPRLQAHITDAFRLADKHLVRATEKRESVVSLPSGKKAVVIELKGEVPSHFQFYMTDTTRHFLRGAVYLNQATQDDSLKPIIDYVVRDCYHLMNSLRWNR